MTSMGEGQIVGLLEYAIRYTAARLGSEDADCKGMVDLQDEIRRRDAETGRLLEAFADAYLGWWRLREQVRQDRGPEPRSPQQQAALAELADRRDTAREALLRRLRRL